MIRQTFISVLVTMAIMTSVRMVTGIPVGENGDNPRQGNSADSVMDMNKELLMRLRQQKMLQQQQQLQQQLRLQQLRQQQQQLGEKGDHEITEMNGFMIDRTNLKRGRGEIGSDYADKEGEPEPEPEKEASEKEADKENVDEKSITEGEIRETKTDNETKIDNEIKVENKTIENESEIKENEKKSTIKEEGDGKEASGNISEDKEVDIKENDGNTGVEDQSGKSDDGEEKVGKSDAKIEEKESGDAESGKEAGEDLKDDSGDEKEPEGKSIKVDHIVNGGKDIQEKEEDERNEEKEKNIKEHGNEQNDKNTQEEKANVSNRKEDSENEGNDKEANKDVANGKDDNENSGNENEDNQDEAGKSEDGKVVDENKESGNANNETTTIKRDNKESPAKEMKENADAAEGKEEKETTGSEKEDNGNEDKENKEKEDGEKTVDEKGSNADKSDGKQLKETGRGILEDETDIQGDNRDQIQIMLHKDQTVKDIKEEAGQNYVDNDYTANLPQKYGSNRGMSPSLESLPETYSLIGVRSFISPPLLAALAEVGMGETIAFVDSTFPASSVLEGSTQDPKSRLIREPGLPMGALMKEVLGLWNLNDQRAFSIQGAGPNEDQVSPWMKKMMTGVVRAGIEKGHDTGTWDTKVLKAQEFRKEVSVARYVVITGESGPGNSIVLRKGLINGPNHAKVVGTAPGKLNSNSLSLSNNNEEDKENTYIGKNKNTGANELNNWRLNKNP